MVIETYGDSRGAIVILSSFSLVRNTSSVVLFALIYKVACSVVKRLRFLYLMFRTN